MEALTAVQVGLLTLLRTWSIRDPARTHSAGAPCWRKQGRHAPGAIRRRGLPCLKCAVGGWTLARVSRSREGLPRLPQDTAARHRPHEAGAPNPWRLSRDPHQVSCSPHCRKIRRRVCVNSARRGV